MTDGWLIDQSLSEYNTLVSPLEALFSDGAALANVTAGHGETFVVEVSHDDNETVVLLTEEMVDWNLDVVELDESSTGRWRVGGLDGGGLDTFLTWDEDDAEPLFGSAGGDEVVAEHTVGDPLLGTVDDIVLAIWGLDGGGSETSNIGTGKSFGDGKADLLFSRHALLGDLLTEWNIWKPLSDSSEGNHETSKVTILKTTSS